MLGSLHGIAHGYYTVQLAPAIAGSLALGSGVLVEAQLGDGGVRWPRVLLILGLLGNAAWGSFLAVHRHAFPPVLIISLVAVTSMVGALTVASTSAVLRRGARLEARLEVLGVVRLRLGLPPAALAPWCWRRRWSGCSSPGRLVRDDSAGRRPGPQRRERRGPASFPAPPDVSPGSAPGDGFDRR